jgi:carbamoyltransferase
VFCAGLQLDAALGDSCATLVPGLGAPALGGRRGQHHGRRIPGQERPVGAEGPQVAEAEGAVGDQGVFDQARPTGDPNVVGPPPDVQRVVDPQQLVPMLLVGRAWQVDPGGVAQAVVAHPAQGRGPAQQVRGEECEQGRVHQWSVAPAVIAVAIGSGPSSAGLHRGSIRTMGGSDNPTTTGAPFPRWGAAGAAFFLPTARALGKLHGLAAPGGPEEALVLDRLQLRMSRGERVLLVGVTAATHAAGAAVVQADQHGIQLVANHEEERFVGVKHYAGFPRHALEAARATIAALGARPTDVGALVAGWDYPALTANLAGWALAELPASLNLFHPAVAAVMPPPRPDALVRMGQRVGAALGLPRRTPLLSLRHHDNHAWGALAMSPFGRDAEPVLVSVIDGTGDDGPLSVYLATGGQLQRVMHGADPFDSIGALYALLSSTQGGWTPLSSEGRYMGAAGFGDRERLTNPYYAELRQVLHFGPQGQVRLNRQLVRFFSIGRPGAYGPGLAALLGPPIPADQMWNPDAVLNVEADVHAAFTRERVDKAAACQLVFEDALFHIIGAALRLTGASRLVLAGGTALNCLANLQLVEHFGDAWYARNLGRRDHLRVWVPPVPGDAGVAAGAAINLAQQAGAPLGAPLAHAFLCGSAPRSSEIQAALRGREHTRLGELGSQDGRQHIAEVMAHVVASGGVLGLFQGAAETGPRALGHRSILADPTNPHVRILLNRRVKHREAIRPLAPMLTLRAARALFELPPGLAEDDWSALRYMVMLVRAGPEARRRVPAVVHVDGTARLQVVRSETDPLCFAYLTAMGRQVGVEVSVNTSLNVGAPIAQSPAQAMATLDRASAMDGIVMVGDDGVAWLCWTSVGSARVRAALATPRALVPRAVADARWQHPA